MTDNSSASADPQWTVPVLNIAGQRREVLVSIDAERLSVAVTGPVAFTVDDPGVTRFIDAGNAARSTVQRARTLSARRAHKPGGQP